MIGGEGDGRGARMRGCLGSVLLPSMVKQRLDLLHGETRVIDGKEIGGGGETDHKDFPFVLFRVAFPVNGGYGVLPYPQQLVRRGREGGANPQKGFKAGLARAGHIMTVATLGQAAAPGDLRVRQTKHAPTFA